MIYFDHAATSFYKPEGMYEAVLNAMHHVGNAGRGSHDGALDADRMLFQARCQIATLFHAEGPTQVVFTKNATESLNIAIQGLLSSGDHVITTQAEHNSVLRPLYHMEKNGVVLSFLTVNQNGVIALDELETAINEKTKMVICTHASNVTGNVTDLRRISTICKRHNLLFVVDASQTAGFLPIDMEELGISVLCFTGHKGLLGPQGTGGMCVRKGVTIRPLMMGGSGVYSYEKAHPLQMPTALEAGTLNCHGIAGLKASISYLLESNWQERIKNELALMWQFYDGIKEMKGIKIYGDFSEREKLRAPIVSCNICEVGAGAVADELFQEYQIATRAGAHCAPLMHQALGTKQQGCVRFSFSFGNTAEEVKIAIGAIKELAKDN